MFGRFLKAGQGSANLATAHLLAAQLLVVGCAFLVNILSARTMGPAGRGHLALLLQITYVGSMFGMAGLEQIYPAMMSTRPTTARAAADLARLATPPAILTATLMIPVGTMLENTGSSGGVIAAVAAVVTLGNVAAAVLRTATAASGSGVVYLKAVAVGQSLLLAASMGLLAAGESSILQWLVAYVMAVTAPPVVAWLLLRSDRKPPTRMAAPEADRIRRAGLAVLPASVASMVMLRSDRLFLPVLGSLEEAGWYIVVATVMELIVWPAQLWVNAHVPVWREQAEAGTLNPVRPLSLIATYGVAAASVATGLGWLLLVPIFGDAYNPSLPLLAPLAVASALYCVSRAGVGVALATGRLRASLWTDVPAMLVAVGAYVLLIPGMGAMGAAWGSLIGYATACVASLTLALRAPAATARTANTHRNRLS